MSIYKNKIIKCPIKIGTLDFHKISEFDKNIKTYKLSQKA